MKKVSAQSLRPSICVLVNLERHEGYSAFTRNFGWAQGADAPERRKHVGEDLDWELFLERHCLYQVLGLPIRVQTGYP